MPNLVNEVSDASAFQAPQKLGVRHLGTLRRGGLGSEGFLDETWIEVELIEKEVVRMDHADAEFHHGLGREVLRIERHDDLTATDYRGCQDVPVLGVTAQLVGQPRVSGHAGVGKGLLHLADPVIGLLASQRLRAENRDLKGRRPTRS